MYTYRYVVRKVLQSTVCPDCANALEANLSNGLRNNYSLVGMKTNGGLLFPSTSVVRICKAAEKQFVLLEQNHTLAAIKGDYLFNRVTIPVVTEIIQDAR